MLKLVTLMLAGTLSLTAFAAPVVVAPQSKLDLAGVTLGMSWKDAAQVLKAENIVCKADTFSPEMDETCEFSFPAHAAWLGTPLAQKPAFVGLLKGKVMFAYMELATVKTAQEQRDANELTESKFRTLAKKLHMTTDTERSVLMLTSVDLTDIPKAGAAHKKAVSSDALWGQMTDGGNVSLSLGPVSMLQTAITMAGARN